MNASQKPTAIEFEVAAAQLVTLDHKLERIRRATDGRLTYLVRHRLRCKTFAHWQDVLAFITSLHGVVR